MKGADDAALSGQADGELERSNSVGGGAGVIVAGAQLRETEVEQLDEAVR